MSTGLSGYAVRWRAATSAWMASSPTPSSRDAVPVKYLSTSSWDSPIASNTWAPVYDATVEMPILDMTFRTPLPSALM